MAELLKKGYDINSPDGIGMFSDKIYSSPENAEKGFQEWIKRFERQGYYSTSYREQIPLEELRSQCRLVDFEFDADEFDGEFI
jgi:hypothetical protein